MRDPRSKFTPARRTAVLDALRRNANVSATARRLGLNRQTLYRWRDADPEFRDAWDAAVEEGIDALEAEAMRRAMQGTPRTVFYQGKPCGEIRFYSDALLMFMLRCRRPWRYAKAAELTRREAGTKPPVVVELVHFGDEESFNDHKAEFDARQAAENGGVAAAMADRLAGGTCLTTEADWGAP